MKRRDPVQPIPSNEWLGVLRTLPVERRLAILEEAILVALPAERREEILAHAVEDLVRSVVDPHRSGTLGALIEAAVRHPGWPLLAGLPAHAVLPYDSRVPTSTKVDMPVRRTPAPTETAPAAPPTTGPRTGRRQARGTKATPPPKPPAPTRAVARTLSPSDFIRSAPQDMRPAEVVAEGARQGLKFTESLVYKARGRGRRGRDGAADSATLGIGTELRVPGEGAAPPAPGSPPLAAAEATAVTGSTAPPASDDDLDVAVSHLGEVLGEADPRVLTELREVVAAWGTDMASAAHRKTLEIEASGGMVRDGRRKTPGGVFFYLMKTRAGRELLGPEFATRQAIRVAAPIPAPPTETPPLATPEPPQSAPGTKAGDLLAAMVGFIAKNPGLREQEIRLRLGGDRLLVRATLDALRAQKKVRTSGSGRGMTYTALD